MQNLIMITDPIFFTLSFKMNHCFPTQTSRRGLHTLPVVPVVVYSNADVDKERVIKENKGRCGVYRWINLSNGKSYVGSSVNLKTRLLNYYNLAYLTKYAPKSNICKALLKHGYSNFSLEILEYCEPDDVVAREQYYIDLRQPEYNILQLAGSSLGYKHTAESIEKMRNRVVSEEYLAKWRGPKHSEETKAKLRALKLNHKVSEETRNKIGASQGTAVSVTDTETGITNIYHSKRQAAKELNTSLDTVRRYIISGNSYKDRYLIEIK
jgi:group I intron endonuclease